MEHFDINFVRSDGKSVNVRLFSHYTCICGKFSGEGKSEFVSLLEDGISTGDISVVSKLPFAIAAPWFVRGSFKHSWTFHYNDR